MFGIDILYLISEKCSTDSYFNLNFGVLYNPFQIKKKGKHLLRKEVLCSFDWFLKCGNASTQNKNTKK